MITGFPFMIRGITVAVGLSGIDFRIVVTRVFKCLSLRVTQRSENTVANIGKTLGDPCSK